MGEGNKNRNACPNVYKNYFAILNSEKPLASTAA